MVGGGSTTEQLIDNIELYNKLLDNNGKLFLTKYILKTRLSAAAELKLNFTYRSNAD